MSKYIVPCLLSLIVSCNNSSFSGSSSVDDISFETFSETYQSSKKTESTLEVLTGETVTSSIEMLAQGETVNKSFKQGEVSAINDAFSLPDRQVDNFQQLSPTVPALDILVVIDNSKSMEEEQKNLSTKLSPLLSAVSDSDWRIAVTTTDSADPCLRDVISKGDSNISSKFANAIKAGTDGSGIEKGLSTAARAFTCQNWMRPGSALSILIVSDEDHCSTGDKCEASEPIKTADDFIESLSSIRQVGLDAKVFGLIWHPNVSSRQCSTALRQGVIYADVIASTLGDYGSICDSNYTSTLNKISEGMDQLLKTRFELSEVPQKSLKVYVSDVLRTSGISLDGKILVLDPAPAAGSAIRVEYRSQENFQFTLSQIPDTSTFKVELNGNILNSSNYQLDANQRILTIDSALGSGDLKASYNTLPSLRNSYTLEPGTDPENLTVHVNDQDWSDKVSYSQGQNKITFLESIPLGSEVKISFLQTKYVTRYAMEVPAEKIATLKVIDKDTSNPVSYNFDNGEIVFEEQDVIAGRIVTVSYENPYKDLSKLPVAEQIIVNNKLKAEAGGKVCASSEISFANNLLDLSKCGFESVSKITISFEVSYDQKTSFALTDKMIEVADKAEWTVKVNGESTKDYSIDNNILSFESLPYGAQVELIARIEK